MRCSPTLQQVQMKSLAKVRSHAALLAAQLHVQTSPLHCQALAHPLAQAQISRRRYARSMPFSNTASTRALSLSFRFMLTRITAGTDDNDDDSAWQRRAHAALQQHSSNCESAPPSPPDFLEVIMLPAGCRRHRRFRFGARRRSTAGGLLLR
jgi:hypothetical protein